MSSHLPDTPRPVLTVASPSEAVQAFIERLKAVGTETVPLYEAAGRVLALDLLADRPSPGADVSAMDGFAARITDLTNGTLAVSGTVRIGAAPPKLVAGCVVRIVTGGGVPSGADVILKREDVTERDGGREILVPEATANAARPSLHIRRAGENAAAGAIITARGALVTPPVAGALATFGVPTPTVHRRVRVAIVVTGDELLGPSQAPTPWQLRESNGFAIAALLRSRVWADVSAPAHAGDDFEPTREVLARSLEHADALIVTGGVSVGERDHVPAALASLGCTVLFHKVPQRPGRPILGAIGPRGQAVLALPGNPVSALVTSRRIGLPVLEHLAGLQRPFEPVAVTITNADTKAIDLWWHRLVRVGGPGRAEFVDATGSGDIPAAAGSDGFVEVPPRQTGPGPWPLWAW